MWSNAWGPGGGWYGHRKLSGDWMVEQACHNWDVIVWANQCLPVRATGFGTTGLFRDTPVVVDSVENIVAIEPDRDVHDYYSGVVEFQNGVIVNIFIAGIAQQVRRRVHQTDRTSRRRRLQLRHVLLPAGYEVAGPAEQRGRQDGCQLSGNGAFLNSVRTRSKPIATAENGATPCCARCSCARRSTRSRSSPRTIKKKQHG